MSRKLLQQSGSDREYVLNPITALAFYTSATDGQVYLLAGEDSLLKVYDTTTSRLCGQIAVFSAQSIHGIDVASAGDAGSSREILVWGGYSVTTISADEIEVLTSSNADGRKDQHAAAKVAEATAPDWILHGLSSQGQNGRVALLTAHNEVVLAERGDGANPLVFRDIQSPSRPILYSGHMSWLSLDRVLVAAGTVFGEILVWTCSLGSEQGPPEISHVFTGHEGSIFGVHISPELTTQSGVASRFLSSCSDDRTIRVWDISEKPSQETQSQAYNSHISDARETGFGGNAEASAKDSSASRCLGMVMGHQSRIWHVEFPQDQPLFKANGLLEIYSFGEDATTQKWHLMLTGDASPIANAEAQPPPSLVHQITYSNHRGKHIWSRAMLSSSERGLVIATGGSDAKIALINDTLNGNHPQVSEEPAHALNSPVRLNAVFSLKDLNEVAKAQPGSEISDDAVPINPKRGNSVENLNRYAFVTADKLLVVTNYGRMFLGYYGTDVSWTQLGVPSQISEAIQNYVVLRSSSQHGLAFIGAAGGEIFIYQESQSLELLTKVHGKVADMFCLADESALDVDGSASDTKTRPLSLFVNVLGSDTALLLSIDVSSGTLGASKSEISLEKGFVVTSAAMRGDILILGSRKGSIAVLEQNSDQTYNQKTAVEVKLNDSVTSIVPLPSGSENSSVSILATCRDGKYRLYELKKTKTATSLELMHEASPPFGPLIEGAWFTSDRGGARSLILYGFRSKHLVVWNETERREIASIDCGGGHRIFTCMGLQGRVDGVRLAFTKASHMHLFSQTHAPSQTLKMGGHGREIRAVSYSGKYLATAAEDTAIRLWSLPAPAIGSSPNPQCLTVLEKHTAGIQTLRWYKHSHLFSSAGNEEFFVWSVHELDADRNVLGVVCEAVFPDRTEDGDLRIMDFDIERLIQKEDAEPLFRITMALSNSSLQSYDYSKAGGFRLLARGSYTGACLTQLRHLFVAQDNMQVLTAGTDGHLAVWKMEPSPETEQESPEQMRKFTCTTVSKLHQSTIKSLEIRARLNNEETTSFLVVTGGDDNAIGVMHLTRSKEMTETRIQYKSITKSVHAAAVTGLTILPLEDNDTDAVVGTVSNDQRFKVWRIANWQSKQPRVLLVEDRYSAVADAGDLEVLYGNTVIVGGVGLEIWNVRK